MAGQIGRRLVAVGFGLFAAGIARSADSPKGPGLDGTWGGSKEGLTAQVIVTGGSVIGFYWADRYFDEVRSRISADAQSLVFDFSGGEGTLTRAGPRTANLEVRHGSRVDHMVLTLD